MHLASEANVLVDAMVISLPRHYSNLPDGVSIVMKRTNVLGGVKIMVSTKLSNLDSL